MKDFSDALPGVRTALIDERDQYLASKIFSAPGKSIVAVIGAGHIPGIKRCIGEDIDLETLEQIPPPKKLSKIIAWTIPSIVLGLICYGFYTAGTTLGFEMLEAWFWVNAILASFGALLALAHPVTIIVAFFVSPFTSLNPFIAAGWVAGLCEAAIRKPTVADLESISDDVSTMRGLWTNRLSRILLVIALTNLFGMLGTFIGAKSIAEMLWPHV
jgi:pheromone shutdown-related protein TraB